MIPAASLGDIWCKLLLSRLQSFTALCAPCSAKAWAGKQDISEQAFLALTQGMVVAPLESVSPCEPGEVQSHRHGSEPSQQQGEAQHPPCPPLSRVTPL